MAATHLLDATMYWNPAGGGGVRRYLGVKSAWLAGACGWRHTLMAPGARGAGEVDCGGWPLPGSGGYRAPLARAALTRTMVDAQPDLIEVADPFTLAWAACDAGRRLGVPTVAFCHGNPMAMGALWGGRVGRAAAARYLARAYRGFDLVLAPSRWMAGELAALGVAAEAQPLGVDSRVFHPSRRDPSWRRSIGVSPAQRVLLYAGRFAPEKHLDVLAEAVRRLGPRYLLLAVGQGPRPPRGAQVRLLPFEPRALALARIVASCDGFVHAGDQETFGLAALEAMACGTPVALRTAAGLAELVEGGAGLAVDGAGIERWAEALAALHEAPGRERRVALARARAEAHDWRRVLPLLVQRYERLLRP
ncbi:MAG TPA: glycosyltransferase, partial [Ideonella sp.]|nr:glycosyltransferase [Ideonella sp.]